MKTISSWMLLAGFCCGSEMALALTPFTAEFDVFENGDRLGAARLELKRTGPDRWLFSTETAGEGGMAGFLGARISEYSDLTEQAGVLSTRAYRYSQEVAWRNRERTLTIDASGQIQEKDRKDRWSYLASGPVLDRHAVVLAVTTDLANTGEVQTHAVAHKGAVTEWRFTQGESEQVKTGIGVLQTTRLERIRENRERRTISWHAPEYAWLPVVIEQIEPDGKHYRMQLKRWIVSPES